MILFLGIQGTYQHVHVGLFKQDVLLDTLSIHNTQASKRLIPTISNLLSMHNIGLEDLSFIAANQGPGPFTTLRTILTTVNGINFAINTPLIGIDTLTSCAYEWEDPAFATTIVLLDAFNHDVYFYIHDNQQNARHDSAKTAPTIFTPNKSGYHNIDTFVTMLIGLKQHPIRFIGNAALLYQQKIESLLGAKAYFPTPMPLICSLSYLGIVGLKAWNNQQTSTQLLPLYLKKHQAEITIQGI